MNLKELQFEVFQENERKLRELMGEIEVYANNNALDYNQKMGIEMLCKVFIDLYQSIFVHYKTVINETSLHVVFRSFYESCLNNIYLYNESNDLTFGKKLDIYTHAAVISVKKTLNNQTSISDDKCAETIRKKIREQDEIISESKFIDIKKNSKKESGYYKNWYSYYTEIDTISDLSDYVGLFMLHKQLYKYLSSDAHGNKVFGNTLSKEEKGEDDIITFYTHVLAFMVLESMNEFINLNGGTPSDLNTLSVKIKLIRDGISKQEQ